jgi:hypothetical protein
MHLKNNDNYKNILESFAIWAFSYNTNSTPFATYLKNNDNYKNFCNILELH